MLGTFEKGNLFFVNFGNLLLEILFGNLARAVAVEALEVAVAVAVAAAAAAAGGGGVVVVV